MYLLIARFSNFMQCSRSMLNYSVNAQVAIGGRVPKKPRDCNRNHVSKELEHPTGLPNPQPIHQPLAPGPPQAPVTLEPDSSEERKEKTGGGG